MNQPFDKLSSDEIHEMSTSIYDRLAKATEKYMKIEHVMANTKSQFEEVFARGLMTGEIVGKNEQERMAVARDVYPEYFEAMKHQQEILATAKLELQLAKIAEAELTMGVRIFELVTR